MPIDTIDTVPYDIAPSIVAPTVELLTMYLYHTDNSYISQYRGLRQAARTCMPYTKSSTEHATPASTDWFYQPLHFWFVFIKSVLLLHHLLVLFVVRALLRYSRYF